MSEEKLYAVKNDEGKWADAGYYFGTCAWATPDKDECERDAKQKGGHVVALVEEPEKVVLTKEQAEIVEKARDGHHPASVLRFSGKDDEELLMNAYVNGYTVEKEKKYLLPMDGTLEENDDNDNFQLYAYFYEGRWLADEVETDPSYKHHTVTQKELETAPAWVKAIKPLEVTDDVTK